VVNKICAEFFQYRMFDIVHLTNILMQAENLLLDANMNIKIAGLF